MEMTIILRERIKMLRRSLYALMGKEIKPEVIPTTAKDKLEKFVPNKRVGSLTDKEKMDKGFNGSTYSINGRDVDF